MNKIFWGLLFVFVSIKINEISLTPAFIGYLLIYLGMTELKETPAFEKARPWAIVAGVLSAVFWLPVWGGGVLIDAVSLVSTALKLWVTYLIVLGVEELEKVHSVPLNGGRLRTAWYVWAVGCIVSLVLARLVLELSLAALVVGLIAAVVYIVAFYQSKQALNEGI